jgi:hypothetical protein
MEPLTLSASLEIDEDKIRGFDGGIGAGRRYENPFVQANTEIAGTQEEQFLSGQVLVSRCEFEPAGSFVGHFAHAPPIRILSSTGRNMSAGPSFPDFRHRAIGSLSSVTARPTPADS